MKCVWFDMDGTVYDLYKIDGWLESLRNDDMTIFAQDTAGRKSLPRIREAVKALRSNGWAVGVITWTPKDVSKDSKIFSECEAEKRGWLMRNFPEIPQSNVFCLEYGTDKTSAFKMAHFEETVLVDDNKEVRQQWREHGKNFHTVDASRGFIKELYNLVG